MNVQLNALLYKAALQEQQVRKVLRANSQKIDSWRLHSNGIFMMIIQGQFHVKCSVSNVTIQWQHIWLIFMSNLAASGCTHLASYSINQTKVPTSLGTGKRHGYGLKVKITIGTYLLDLKQAGAQPGCFLRNPIQTPPPGNKKKISTCLWHAEIFWFTSVVWFENIPFCCFARFPFKLSIASCIKNWVT